MFGNIRSKRDMTTCWISDLAGSKCAASGAGGGGGGLTVVEGVTVDGGGVGEEGRAHCHRGRGE